MDTIVFAYYDTSMSDVVHIDDGIKQPTCGTLYGEQGEFLSSRDDYEVKIVKSYGIDIHTVTCKKCLKILQKSKETGGLITCKNQQ